MFLPSLLFLFCSSLSSRSGSLEILTYLWNFSRICLMLWSLSHFLNTWLLTLVNIWFSIIDNILQNWSDGEREWETLVVKGLEMQKMSALWSMIEVDGDCCHQMMRVEGSLGLVLRIIEMASGLKYLLRHLYLCLTRTFTRISLKSNRADLSAWEGLAWSDRGDFKLGKLLLASQGLHLYLDLN